MPVQFKIDDGNWVTLDTDTWVLADGSWSDHPVGRCRLVGRAGKRISVGVLGHLGIPIPAEKAQRPVEDKAIRAGQTKQELKDHAEALGLLTSGSKADLEARIRTYEESE